MPPIKANRSTFTRSMRNKEVDTQKLKADSKMEGVDVDKADLNADGKISGDAEANQLFTEIDRSDRDGSINSLVAENDGAKTKAGDALDAVAQQATPKDPAAGRATRVSIGRQDNLARAQFSQALDGKSMSVGTLKADARLTGVNVGRADLNRDGKIAGKAETDKLFGEIDKKDHNGKYGSVRVKRGINRPAGVAKQVAAVGDAAGAKALSDLAPGSAQAATPTPAAQPNAPSAKSMADAANGLVRDHAQNYGTDDPWVNNDPNHAMPVGVRLGGLKGKWKCNLFGGNAMYAAGFQPPYYGNKGHGEYPNANQMFKWSNTEAAKYGNKVHFENRGDITPGDYPAGPERDRAVAAMLAKAEPGDMVIVDHQGTGVADGGHVRVVVGNNMKPDGSGTMEAAQASSQQAEVQNERLGDFTGEERIWILRPNRPQVE